jgi:cellulose synthase/poly-beta-1,6-N-acetylglucosamine synthase-like glycosyltransferase
MYVSTKPKKQTEPNKVSASLTILVPVYKESFQDIIRPTLEQALETCETYREQTGQEANVYVNDDGLATLSTELREERCDFYREKNISFSERAAEGRKGKFKKAGNMNHGLQTGAANDILLILDSDSRLPKDIAEAVYEFQDSALGFLQMSTHSMRTGTTHWESIVSHFTDTIYDVAFLVTTSYGDPSPLVGHNVFLRKSALEECKLHSGYFSEKHVSEDFELSMRLQAAGYIGRYATCMSGFEEGVTYSAIDEIIRLQKYAYGINELVLYPISKWNKKGIFGNTFKNYILSHNVSLHAKYNVIGYVGIFYALAVIPFMTTIHYFAYHTCPYWRESFITPEYIFYGCMLVFGIMTPISIWIIKAKLGIRTNLLREIGIALAFSIFYSGLGIHILAAILAHSMGLDMSWSITNKDASTVVNRLKSVRRLWMSYMISILQLVMILIGFFLLDYRHWQGIFPMAISAGGHILTPILGSF